jgi:hypothetical protein
MRGFGEGSPIWAQPEQKKSSYTNNASSLAYRTGATSKTVVRVVEVARPAKWSQKAAGTPALWKSDDVVVVLGILVRVYPVEHNPPKRPPRLDKDVDVVLCNITRLHNEEKNQVYVSMKASIISCQTEYIWSTDPNFPLSLPSLMNMPDFKEFKKAAKEASDTRVTSHVENAKAAANAVLKKKVQAAAEFAATTKRKASAQTGPKVSSTATHT